MQNLYQFIKSMPESKLKEIINDDYIFKKFNYEFNYGPAPHYNSLSMLPVETQFSLMKAFIDNNKSHNEEKQNPLLQTLKTIAEWPGNLPDDRLTSKTGPNDAALRGSMLVAMRTIAIKEIQKVEPDYNPVRE